MAHTGILTALLEADITHVSPLDWDSLPPTDFSPDCILTALLKILLLLLLVLLLRVLLRQLLIYLLILKKKHLFDYFRTYFQSFTK